jgi:hypothetical protein
MVPNTQVGQEPLQLENETADSIETPASARIANRRFGLGAIATVLVALALLANSYRIEDRELAAQRDAEVHGVVVPTVIEGALWSGGQNQTRVLVVVRGVERRTSVFAGHPRLTRGTPVRVAWAPADPARIYIVGVRPWTWWAAKRPLFGTLAGVSLILAVTSLLLDLTFARE